MRRCSTPAALRFAPVGVEV